MLRRLRVRNFKRLREAEVPLGPVTFLVGPNNSGKTTALQALALWGTGLRRWLEERGKDAPPAKRPGVAINRRDLTCLPVPEAKALWTDLHVRGQRPDGGTRNLRIDLTVEGDAPDGSSWSCGFEFDYATDESLLCRPLRLPGQEDRRVGEAEYSRIPDVLVDDEGWRVLYLPPMSGLASVEPKVEPGRIEVLLGEGRTAEVLRNLCYLVSQDHPETWTRIAEHMVALFGVELEPPEYLGRRGEIVMGYRERERRFDLSALGRGAQQVLLLLAFLGSRPRSVLLLDEPDAHLEILRQRRLYGLLADLAARNGSQLVIASHSEVMLEEAAAREDVVVAFLGGRPRPIDRGRVAQVRKALAEIPALDYVLAEQEGWVLYVEGSTDWEILRAFARRLDHPVASVLERGVFVHYVGANQPTKVYDHFFGLREAKPDLLGVAVFDRLERPPEPRDGLTLVTWRRREIENYLCVRQALETFAAAVSGGDDDSAQPTFFADTARREMSAAIDEVEDALRKLGKDPWSGEIKASEEFLEPLFRAWARRGGRGWLRKSEYHRLVEHMEPASIDPEVVEKLDLIATVIGRVSGQGKVD